MPSAPTSTSSESSQASHCCPSCTHTDPDNATAQPRNGIAFSNVLDAGDPGDGRADITPSSSLASKHKAGETTENQRARRGSKRENRRGILGRVAPGSDLCARLNGIPDHVLEDLDGASRLPHPHYLLGDPGAILFLTLPSIPHPCSVVLRDQLRFVALFPFVICVILQLSSLDRTPPCSPGYLSAARGHHYANPTSHFWRCLHLSGQYVLLTHIAPYPLPDTPEGNPNKVSRQDCYLRLRSPHFQGRIASVWYVQKSVYII